MLELSSVSQAVLEIKLDFLFIYIMNELFWSKEPYNNVDIEVVTEWSKRMLNSGSVHRFYKPHLFM